MQNDIFVEYAPILIVVVMFLVQYKFFVTPSQMKDALEDLEKKFVLRETNDIIINALKDDISEIKKDVSLIREQQQQMYNKIMELP